MARSTEVPSSTYQLLKSYLRRPTHPINAHMIASLDHKVSVVINFAVLFLWLREAGAPLSYVQRLSISNINMDMTTFTSLDKNVVLVSFYVYECVKQEFLFLFQAKRSSSLLSQNLMVGDVRGLLGSNLNQLKSYENQTLVQSWIRLQPQSQLDTLAIGLTGGTTSDTSTVSGTTHSGTSGTVDPNAATNTAATTTTTVTTTGGSCKSFQSVFRSWDLDVCSEFVFSSTLGSRATHIRADAGLFVLLLIFITSHHMFV